MTARALELIASADAILYDRLIPAGALAGARADAELIYVGKAPGDAAMPQERIERSSSSERAAGSVVVRLKGGDPFVFGRGGEEAEALARPGSSSRSSRASPPGVAAPAYAGIPVTHRDDASAVAFVTGHEDPDKDETAIDWEALAPLPGHARPLHGRRRTCPRSPRRLIDAGRDPGEPAAAVERGTLPASGRSWRRSDRSPPRSPRPASRPPAILLFGPVAARREDDRLARAPPAARQAGRRHPGARPGERASARRSTALGAEVVELPAIRIEPRIDAPEVRAAVESLHTYALVCLTSPNGVRLLFEAMARAGPRRPGPRQAQVAAIGPGTAAALGERGVIADIVPERFVAEALVEALAGSVEGKPVLVARAAEARDVLPEALRERGAEVDVVALYETVREDPRPERDRGRQGGRLRHLHLLLDGAQLPRGGRRPDARGSAVVSIGPVTSETAREAGLEVARRGRAPRPGGPVEALVADAGAASELGRCRSPSSPTTATTTSSPASAAP